MWKPIMAAADQFNQRVIRAFTAHYADLVEVLVDPDGLAVSLYSNKLISKGTLEKATNTSYDRMRKSNVVIDAVEASLDACKETRKVSTILSILEKHPPLNDVVAKIRRAARSEFRLSVVVVLV